MITPKQTEAFKKTIGSKYITKLKSYADDHNRKKDNNKPFSATTFSRVLNGDLEHTEVEKIIFDCANYWFEKNQKEEARRNEFLKKVNAK